MHAKQFLLTATLCRNIIQRDLHLNSAKYRTFLHVLSLDLQFTGLRLSQSPALKSLCVFKMYQVLIKGKLKEIKEKLLALNFSWAYIKIVLKN